MIAKALLNAFEIGNVQIFIGSGLSKPPYPSVNDFKQKVLDEPIVINRKISNVRTALNNVSDEMISFEDAAQFYEIYAGEEELLNKIKYNFDTPEKPKKVHTDIWKLPNVKWIYTTNWDCLIEDALGKPQQTPQIITNASKIRDIPEGRRVVFKPHGCARTSENRNEFVITRNDYLNYSNKRPLEWLRTQYDIATKVFLFLGYSLNDLNIRHIITEASKYSKIKAFAVLTETNGPESEYWDKLGVKIVEMSVENFIDELFKHYPPNEAEWEAKINARVQDKIEIANKAVRIIEDYAKDNVINIILDAGSTSVHLARKLTLKLKNDQLDADKLQIITNSPVIIDELTKVMSIRGKMSSLYIIGGPFRYNTRAFAPEKESAKFQLSFLNTSNNFTLAFIGATAINEKGLLLGSSHEANIKNEFISCANEVFILADHAKTRILPKGNLFSKWIKNKMKIITDRPEELSVLSSYVNKII